MKVTLQPMEEMTISGRGETIVYMSGSEQLLLMASGKRAEIPSGSQITFPAFEQFTVQNKGHSVVNAELLVVEGEFRSLAEGSTVRIQGINDPVEVNEVQRIVEAITANVNNPAAISNPIVTALAQTLTADVNNPTAISNPIVTALAQTLTADVNNPAAISNPIVTALSQTLTADVNNPAAISDPIVSAVGKTLKASITNVATLTNPIIDALSQTLETLEKPATSLASSSKTFTAGESFTIPANTNRRDITIMASEDNTDTVTVAGIPLRAGQYVELTKYTGAVTAQGIAANDQIFITEVIK